MEWEKLQVTTPTASLNSQTNNRTSFLKSTSSSRVVNSVKGSLVGNVEVTCFTVVNNVIVVCTPNLKASPITTTILRWQYNFLSASDTTTKEQIEEIGEISERADNVYLDPTGIHLLICSSSQGGVAGGIVDGLYYFSSGNKRSSNGGAKLKKVLSRLPSIAGNSSNCIRFVKFLPTSVAPSNIASFLFGSSLGGLYEMSLDPNLSTTPSPPSLLLQLSGEDLSPLNISCVAVYKVEVVVVVLCTSNPIRLYPFQHLPAVTNATSSPSYQFTELPGGSDHIFSEQLIVSAEGAFALLTAVGVYHGRLVHSSSGTVSVVETQLLPFLEAPSPSPPVSLVASPLHFFVLWSNCLQLISRLDGSVVQQHKEVEVENCLRLLRDGYGGGEGLWLLTSSSLFSVNVAEEDRHLWEHYLAKALSASGDELLFQQAMQYCKTEVVHNQP